MITSDPLLIGHVYRVYTRRHVAGRTRFVGRLVMTTEDYVTFRLNKREVMTITHDTLRAARFVERGDR